MFFFHYAPELMRIFLNASSVTARVLSLAVLILSVAPLGSIYVLFFSVGWGTGNPPNHTSNNNINSALEYKNSISALLNNPNATLDDLWRMLVSVAHTTTTTPTTIANPSTMSHGKNHPHELLKALLQQPNARFRRSSGNDVDWLAPNGSPAAIHHHSSMQYHHVRILLPWILSFVLGVLIPFVLSILTLLRRRRRHMRRSHNNRYDRSNRNSLERRKKIMQQLHRELSPFTKVLGNSDRWDGDVASDTRVCASFHAESDQDDTEETMYTRQWSIPKPGVTAADATCKRDEQLYRAVNGFCGICLDAFVESQSVSWSSNPDCTHCFHGSCMQAWLSRAYSSSARHAKNQCPCCRRAFINPCDTLPTPRAIPT